MVGRQPGRLLHRSARTRRRSGDAALLPRARDPHGRAVRVGRGRATLGASLTSVLTLHANSAGQQDLVLSGDNPDMRLTIGPALLTQSGPTTAVVAIVVVGPPLTKIWTLTA